MPSIREARTMTPEQVTHRQDREAMLAMGDQLADFLANPPEDCSLETRETLLAGMQLLLCDLVEQS
jgi:hypothetical protein